MSGIKKILKYLSLLLLLLLLLWGVLLAFVFSPRFLTPRVESIAQQYVKGDFSLKNIDVSLFNRFPNITVRIDSLTISQTRDSIDDLLFARECKLAIDPTALLFKRVAINHCSLRDAKVYLYVDSLHGPLKCFNLPDDEDAEVADSSALAFDLSGYEFKLRRMVVDSVEFVIDDRVKNFYSQIRNFGLEMKMDLSSHVSKMKISTGFDNILVWQDGELFAKKTSMSLDAMMRIDLDSMMMSFRQADLRINDIEFKSTGRVSRDTLNNSLHVDVTSSLNTPSLSQFLELVPSSMLEGKEEISTEGKLSLDLIVAGEYSDSSLPTFTAQVNVEGAKARYASRRLSIDNVNYDGEIFYDPNTISRSYVQLNNLYINTSGILEVTASGRISDFMSSPYVDMSLRSTVDFDRFTELFTLNEGLICKGSNISDLKAQFLLNDIMNGNYAKLYIDGESEFRDMEITFDASRFVRDSSQTAYLYLKANRGKMLFGERVLADNNSRTLRSKINLSGLNYISKSGEYMSIKDIELAAGANFDRQTSEINGLGLRGIAKNTAVGVEDLFAASLQSSDMIFTITPKSSNRATTISAKIVSEHVEATELTFNSTMSLLSANMDLLAKQTDSAEWDTSGTISFSDYSMKSEFFPLDINIFDTTVSLADRIVTLENANFAVGESEFVATGKIKNLVRKFFADPRAEISGALSIKASMFNATEFINASNQSYIMLDESGMLSEEESNLITSSDDNVEADVSIQPSVTAPQRDSLIVARRDTVRMHVERDTMHRDTSMRRGGGPMPNTMLFMVPRRVSFVFDLNIKQLLFEDTVIEDVVGRAVINQGALSLQRLTMKALGADASGSMTYKNARGGNADVLFNMDLRGVDINRIGELGESINAMFPMLESFEGIVDFNMKASTRLLNTAQVDYSTLRSAISFKGKELVLMDGETFATISKMLLFKNKNRNLIDTLELYALVNNTEVEVLPFAMTIDRYTAYIAGLQVIDPDTFDVEYNYNISIIKSPLPFKAGVNVNGDLNDFKFKVTSATLKKTNFYDFSLIRRTF